MSEEQTMLQKILLYGIYALVVLMVVFSLISLKDKDFSGYQKCVQNKCEQKGEVICHKLREQNNCCMGAGGQLAMNGNKEYTCVFG